MPSPQAILFDLDETLVWLDVDEAASRHRSVWQPIAQELGIDIKTLIEAHTAAIPNVWRAIEERSLLARQRFDGIEIMLETYRAAH